MNQLNSQHRTTDQSKNLHNLEFFVVFIANNLLVRFFLINFHSNIQITINKNKQSASNIQVL